MKRPFRPIAVAGAALALAGCAAMQPPSFPPGTAQSEVEARMGRPPSVVKAPDGDTVWQYPNGPVGQTTYMVRLGPDQRVKSVTQALTLREFAKIQRGTTEGEVRLLLGPPGETMYFARLNEEVWSYRYQASLSDNRIFNVNFDAKTRVVRSTGDQIDVLLNPIDFGTSASGL
jgi:endonuclease YncB( thermonuclease family)